MFLLVIQVASAGLLGSTVQTLSNVALTDVQTVIVNLQNVLTGSGEKAEKLLQKLQYKSCNQEGIQGLVQEINMAIEQKVPANTAADLTQCFDAGEPSISAMAQKAGKSPFRCPHRVDTVCELSCKLHVLLLQVRMFRFCFTRSAKERKARPGSYPEGTETVYTYSETL
jgi:hypothetical protein